MKNKRLFSLSLLVCFAAYQTANAIPCPNINTHQANQIVANMRLQNPIRTFVDNNHPDWNVTLNFGNHLLQNVNGIHAINLTNAAGNSVDHQEGTTITHACQYNVLAANNIQGDITLESITHLQTPARTNQNEPPRLGRNPFLRQDHHQREGASTGTSTN